MEEPQFQPLPVQLDPQTDSVLEQKILIPHSVRTRSSISYVPAAGATVTLNLTNAVDHRITMPAGNITIALQNDRGAEKFVVSITQDSVGSRTVTWFTTIRWQNATVPTLTTTANQRDTFGFIRTGSSTYDGFIIGQGI